jgi:beta-glucanase (GH16 family)
VLTRRLLPLVLAIAALASIVALIASSHGTTASNGGPTTSFQRQYVAATGIYDVVVRLTGAGAPQSVTVHVPGTLPQVVSLAGHGSTSVDFRTTVKQGILVVRAVGSSHRPSVQVAVWDQASIATLDRHSSVGHPATKLVWSDEFNGPAGTPPQASKWVRDAGPYGAHDHELENYTGGPANASLDGHGDLAIVARRQTTTIDGVTRYYTSARLETTGRFSATYGLIEARMKIAAGAGLWSAFWMLGNDMNAVGWPDAGELDVMEAIGQNPFTARSTVHGPSGSSSYSRGQDFVSGTSLASRFHTYAISWRPNSITWLIDGAPYATVTPADLAPGQTCVFNKPFDLILNLAVGGSWPGPPNGFTTFPATMLVDWVRVYR